MNLRKVCRHSEVIDNIQANRVWEPFCFLYTTKHGNQNEKRMGLQKARPSLCESVRCHGIWMLDYQIKDL